MPVSTAAAFDAVVETGAAADDPDADFAIARKRARQQS
jgi:hypothetical protein